MYIPLENGSLYIRCEGFTLQLCLCTAVNLDNIFLNIQWIPRFWGRKHIVKKIKFQEKIGKEV